MIKVSTSSLSASMRTSFGRLFQVFFASAAALLTAGAALAQSAPAKVDLARGQQIAGQVCAACHGADGNAPTPANPKLAGQHPDYLYKQLVNFVPKQGAKEAERANAIMAGMAAGLSDADRRDLSAYYAKQPLKPSLARNKHLARRHRREAGSGLRRLPRPGRCGYSGAVSAPGRPVGRLHRIAAHPVPCRHPS
jgi:cytochrome c553